jgi:hypothetical protein
MRDTAETNAIRRRVVIGALIQIEPVVRSIHGDRITVPTSVRSGRRRFRS